MALIINYIGTQNIETDRLLLRKFLGWSAHKNIDETYKVLNEWLEKKKKNNYLKWCITLKEKDEAIGDISIILLLEKEACGEIGYVLSKKYWNNGIMTEALTAVISFLFEKATLGLLTTSTILVILLLLIISIISSSVISFPNKAYLTPLL